MDPFLSERTLVGYQPVGMNPIGLGCRGFCHRKTVNELLSAFAAMRYLLFALIVTEFVVDPSGESGWSDVET